MHDMANLMFAKQRICEIDLHIPDEMRCYECSA